MAVRQALAVAAQQQNLRVQLGNFSTDSDKLHISISDNGAWQKSTSYRRTAGRACGVKIKSERIPRKKHSTRVWLFLGSPAEYAKVGYRILLHMAISAEKQDCKRRRLLLLVTLSSSQYYWYKRILETRHVSTGFDLSLFLIHNI